MKLDDIWAPLAGIDSVGLPFPDPNHIYTTCVTNNQANTCARTHTHTNNDIVTRHTHTHAHTLSHTHCHTHTHTHTHTHEHANARTHAHTETHTRPPQAGGGDVSSWMIKASGVPKITSQKFEIIPLKIKTWLSHFDRKTTLL